MSVHDNRRATVNKRVTEFGGIRSIARISDSGSSDMKNFRILPDGSLEKRCGFETVILGTKPIRGYWEAGKPTSISLKPIFTSIWKNSSFSARLIGTISA